MGSKAYLSVLSDIFGWIYFFSWSFSFWVQIHLNWKRKSVRGLSFDYQLYNFTGFLAYLAFSLITYIENRRNSLEATVKPNDLAFAGHAFFSTTLTVIQICIYDRENQSLSLVAVLLVSQLCVIGLYNAGLSSAGCLPWQKTGEFSSTEYLGYVKVIVSFVKYVPQAWMNYHHKTTKGFSIGNVMLDFTGGIFSIGQQIIDSVVQHDWSPLIGNKPKLLLAIESIFFDILFIVQHFCLYGPEGDRPPGEGRWKCVREKSSKISGNQTNDRPEQVVCTPKFGQLDEPSLELMFC